MDITTLTDASNSRHRCEHVYMRGLDGIARTDTHDMVREVAELV